MNIIEVGANSGGHTEKLLEQYPDAQFYLFEPTRELIWKDLIPKFGHLKNVHIIPFAIDIENTFKQFNVAGHEDWGCSSLHNFSSDIQEIWPRDDFRTTHSYIVPTIKLKTFCDIYNIGEIDFLWIDAQGNDYNVLLSLEDKIDDVKEGQCEGSWRVKLYEGVENGVDTILQFLTQKGFDTKLESNDHTAAEGNVFFQRSKIV